MPTQMEITKMEPNKRRLDGALFRVRRGDEYEDVCFTDLSLEEIETISAGRDAKWWKSIALFLRDTIRDIGDHFDIVGEPDV